MGSKTGFMNRKREEPSKQDPLHRTQNWLEYQIPLSDEKITEQASRCMDCGTPFCHTGILFQGRDTGCPLSNLIPDWNDLVYRNRWKEALDRLLETNNFPEFTGKICPAPCEGSCTLAIHDSAVSIKSIEQAIIDKGFAEGWITPNPPTQRTEKKVVIVGSGPAGLACADELNKQGHEVTVLERSDRIGGLLMYGIPNMKLEKSTIQRRVDLLIQEGIQFVTNMEVGKNISMEQLQSDYDAVILCTGATQPRTLNVEGSNVAGVIYAMDYLTDSTKHLLDPNDHTLSFNAAGKDVIVIGGGDTGADCVATALRQKCRSVTQFGKHPSLPQDRAEDNPWPEFPYVFSLDYAYEEATSRFEKDPREYCIQTKKILRDASGSVQELHTIQMEKSVDENGEVTFREIPGTEQIWPTQMVLIAIGYSGGETAFYEQVGVEYTNGKVKTSYGEYQTNLECVFVAGDARRGQSLVVWAIHEGREAARECHKYLTKSAIQ
ncbi:glutamate synthase subunit beta [Risungbinella massiliensis]|uniref:glutamate synthase subunit beta n=1 Tax=Risungbinella massiliensis TaxID=1329796 RepID=UPI0005CB9820|nr:glutamate synthase subunit beta [Risungbinella massiliensis]